MLKYCFTVAQEDLDASKAKEQELQAELDTTKRSSQGKDQIICNLKEQMQKKQEELSFHTGQVELLRGDLERQQQMGKAGPNQCC